MSYCFDMYDFRNGDIYIWEKGEEYYDVDWGYVRLPGSYVYLCKDTPENRKKYGIQLDL